MTKSINANGDITINGLTFLQFINNFRGKLILSKGKEIPKYQLYWSGLSPEIVKEKFIILQRD